MSYLGVNIYCSDAEQKRLLLNGLRPWGLETRSHGISDFFWYRCFDARGPHIFALFCGAVTLRCFLENRIGSFLQGCGAGLSMAEVHRRHRQCLGKTLCAPDRQAGFADNNSFVFFDHKVNDYPTSLTDDLVYGARLRQCLDAFSFWSLECVEKNEGSVAAIQWMASVDRSLHRCGIAPASYWRFHAEKLLPVIARIASNPEWRRKWLQCAITDRNRRLLSHHWHPIRPRSAMESGHTERAVNVIIEDPRRDLPGKLECLYELSEMVLHQLFQPLSRQTVLVLYAWEHSLAHRQ